MKNEAGEQQAFCEWCELCNLPIFAIPNGGKRNAAEAVNLKRTGLKAGVPDLMLPIPNSEHHGLFIEMKYGKNKLTENQEKWISKLTRYGYKCEVCWGANEAIEAVKKYLSK